MNKFIIAIGACSLLFACSDGTNPFTEEEEVGETETGIEGDRELPPGTNSPTPNVGIIRSEPTKGGHDGDGFAQNISYDASDDTFTVDNLGFDGNNVYSRGVAVSSIGPYAVYEAAKQYTDVTTGSVINQFTHRAIYGISTSANTQFAIVRTGAYFNYGFGGFVYQRNNSVTIPSSGQARYTGAMSGLRDFDGASGIEYTTADLEINIDFDDFNDATGTRGDAITGTISNRHIFDINGKDITDIVLARIEVENDITLTSVPVASFIIAPNVLDDNGEILGTVQSYYTNSTGDTEVFETGKYYAIISGNDAEEIVGIIVLENSLDPIGDTRETSGFIVYR